MQSLPLKKSQKMNLKKKEKAEEIEARDTKLAFQKMYLCSK